MSLLSWMFPAKKAVLKTAPDNSGLPRVETTLTGHPVPPSTRKHQRMARRELLYGVVREAMVRAGVLTASYKFKVLSLDGRGRRFTVMVDLARDSGADAGRLADIEALIAQSAKARHDIVVTAVYWRMSEHVGVAVGTRAQAEPAQVDPGPAPQKIVPVPRSPHEPIGEDEVAAFKRAVTAGLHNPAAAAAAAVGVSLGASAVAFDGSSRHGPQSYTLLTGFEDTEVADEARAPILSGTQYGELN